MGINEIILYIMMFFMVLGALDKIFGNKYGLGEKFDEGFMAMGSLSIAMLGVVSIAPVLAKVLGVVVVPVYTFLGADPAMFATTLLANDMGGYPLAKAMALTPEAGSFAGLILGAMMGPTIVFTIPVAARPPEAGPGLRQPPSRPCPGQRRGAATSRPWC